jgi:hypothetical protein
MAEAAAESVKKMTLEEAVPSSSDQKPVAIIVIGKICINYIQQHRK